jgi:Tfp pilus assembly major pilin PilA
MKKQRRGLTLIEAAIAIGVVGISSLGALSYQYYSARQLRVASVTLASMRVGQMLLEDWKGKGGDDVYDPTKLGMGFAKDTIGTDYIVTIDGQRFYIWLTHADVTTDSLAGVTLRELKCTVRWRSDLTARTPGTDDPTAVFATYIRRGED